MCQAETMVECRKATIALRCPRLRFRCRHCAPTPDAPTTQRNFQQPTPARGHLTRTCLPSERCARRATRGRPEAPVGGRPRGRRSRRLGRATAPRWRSSNAPPCRAGVAAGPNRDVRSWRAHPRPPAPTQPLRASPEPFGPAPNTSRVAAGRAARLMRYARLADLRCPPFSQLAVWPDTRNEPGTMAGPSSSKLWAPDA